MVAQAYTDLKGDSAFFGKLFDLISYNYNWFLDVQLDCLAYGQMGPAEKVIRSKDGQKQYLVITYRRGGEQYRLQAPLHFSAYFERSPLYFKHP